MHDSMCRYKIRDLNVQTLAREMRDLWVSKESEALREIKEEKETKETKEKAPKQVKQV